MEKTRQDESIPIVEEDLRVDKKDVVTGRVRVRTETDTVEELAHASLDSETVEVQRIPCDRIVDTVPSVRTEGDVTIVPVVEEIMVVEKRLVLKEELHIRRRRTSKDFETPVTLRKQRAIVERLPADESSKSEPSA